MQSEQKKHALDLATRYVCPGRMRMFEALGVDLVIGRRDGYRIWDVDGHELLDYHLNGGVFSLGHRNPEVVATLKQALEEVDVGNHHFPSVSRGRLGEALARLTPGDLQYSVFAPGGGEAIDVAIKTARHATKRYKVVSVERGYHGHTRLALAAGDDRFSKMFLSEGPAGHFVQVPFNELDAMREALAGDDVAAVVIETIPATYGFPLPAADYLAGVKDLCTRHGALYVADEVQTGLGRTGEFWGVQCFGVQPDILVTGKGLSGGIYPVAAAVLSPGVAGWLQEDGWAHVSTFGGAELGCEVALKVLEICTRDDVRANVHAVSQRLGQGLEDIRSRYPEWFVEIRQQGLVMGLKFGDPQGGMLMSKALYEEGIWAMFAGLDMSVLQFKPGLLLDRTTCDETLERFERGVRRCLESVR
jgi:acetylornithine/succinyldiaminopimelate/putrescine aminotransferase